jgi:hypothetical protein
MSVQAASQVIVNRKLFRFFPSVLHVEPCSETKSCGVNRAIVVIDGHIRLDARDEFCSSLRDALSSSPQHILVSFLLFTERVHFIRPAAAGEPFVTTFTGSKLTTQGSL